MAGVAKNNQNVDNVLDSVSDQIIKKKKFKRTLISSILLSIVVVICAIVISLASIKMDFQPNFLKNADGYNVWISGVNKKYIDDESSNYSEFMQEYDDNFKTTVLAAIFSGRVAGYSIQETTTAFYSNSTAKTGMSSALKTELGNSYIELIYNGEQQVKNRDGSQYYSTRYKPGEYALKFQHCYLKLDSTSQDQMTFYLGTYDTSKPTITKVVVKADSNVLYEYFA